MTDWSEAELATLSQIAETFVEGDGPRRAELAAEALELAADPSQVRQFRLVLRILESPIANLVVAGTARSFRSMSPIVREKYLLSWGRSRLPLRRSAFQGLRKLLTFLAYADPGLEQRNPRLVAMDYRPDMPEVTRELTTIVPTRLPFERTTADRPMQMEADAVIVGSGAGGGVVAAALATAGRSVVVLEAGPFVDEASMPTDELDAYRRLYLNSGLLTTWDGSITMLAGAAVGGGTLVNWMTCLPAPPWVREEWQDEHGVEGAISGPTWDADVEAIEAELSVAEAPRIPPKDDAILRGAAVLGWDARRTRRNATGCGDCGSCPFGCRPGTKRSGIRAHLAVAHAAGARIVPDVRVTRVLVEQGRAVGVEANAPLIDPATGEPATGGPLRRLVVRAGVVVLAAGALRTPSVLQSSGLEHQAIGRHLRLHPAPLVAGVFPEPVDMWRGTMQAARSLEFAEPGPGHNGYVIESAPGHPGLLALALPWEGTHAHSDIMMAARHVGPLVGVTRDGGSGRTTLTRARRVRIDYRLDAAGVSTLRHALVSMARLARAAGAEQILAVGTRPAWHHRGGDFASFESSLASFDFRPNRGGVFSAHQMGTVRMGAEPRGHPCDPWGRVRRNGHSDRIVPGLYVADGSLLPTGIGVNPMVTIMVLARRVGRTILAET
jgi:choline dehydrogenase-like flavoprotein